MLYTMLYSIKYWGPLLESQDLEISGVFLTVDAILPNFCNITSDFKYTTWYNTSTLV